MKKISILLASLVCLSLAFGGCSNNTSPAKNEQTSATNVNETEDKKTLIIGYGTDLDPYIPISNNEYILPICGLSNDTLVEYNNGEIVPCLAESWDINNDGKEIIFHLRDDVTFHNGEKFDANSAATCLKYYKDYEMFSWMKGVSTISEAAAVDENTLKVTYEDGYYATLADLTSAYKLPMVSPDMIIEGNYETMNEPIGTGAYIYDTYKKGDYTKFIRNENYWGEKPEFEEVIVKFIPDSATRLKALQTGEIDMVFSSIFINYDEFKQATSLPNVSGNISESAVKTRNIVVNSASENLEDINVRRAIAMSIDKEDIVKGLTYSYENVATNLFSKKLNYCDIKLENNYEFDKENAKQLLEKSGWVLKDGEKYRTKNGKQLSLVFTYPSGATLNKEIASVIKSNLEEIGINLETKGLEFMTWYTEGMEGNFDLSIGTTYGPPYDPHNYMTPMLDSIIDTVAISGLDDSEQFFSALKQTTQTADKEKVAELYNYMLNYLNNNAVEIPISYQKEMVIYNTDSIESYDFGGLPTELNPQGINVK